jgi:hypothetical protein
MVNIHLIRDTQLPPERIIAALTDFSDRRLELFPNLDKQYFTVHQTGDTHAEVTEGSSFAGGIWERARYDWSKPGTVTLTVVESNAFAPGSTWRYRIEPKPGGGSRVELTVHRVPRTARARLLAIPMALFGAKIFGADLAKTLDRLASAADAAKQLTAAPSAAES